MQTSQVSFRSCQKTLHILRWRSRLWFKLASRILATSLDGLQPLHNSPAIFLNLTLMSIKIIPSILKISTKIDLLQTTKILCRIWLLRSKRSNSKWLQLKMLSLRLKKPTNHALTMKACMSTNRLYLRTNKSNLDTARFSARIQTRIVYAKNLFAVCVANPSLSNAIWRITLTPTPARNLTNVMFVTVSSPKKGTGRLTSKPSTRRFPKPRKIVQIKDQNCKSVKWIYVFDCFGI